MRTQNDVTQGISVLCIQLPQVWKEYLNCNHLSVWVLFNSISTSVGHLIPRKVRLVLSSVGFRPWVFLLMVFDSIWPDIGEKVRFFGRLNVLKFSLVGWLVLWHKDPCWPLKAKLCLYTLNLRFTNEYQVDNIPNESEPTCQHTN